MNIIHFQPSSLKHINQKWSNMHNCSYFQPYVSNKTIDVNWYNYWLITSYWYWLCLQYTTIFCMTNSFNNHVTTLLMFMKILTIIWLSFQGSLCKGLGFDVLLHVFVYTWIWISFFMFKVFIFPWTMKHDVQILMFCDPLHETTVNSALSIIVCKRFPLRKLETSRVRVLHYCLPTQMLLVIGLTPH
jgi:hypothetical protein